MADRTEEFLNHMAKNSYMTKEAIDRVMRFSLSFWDVPGFNVPCDGYRIFSLLEDGECFAAMASANRPTKNRKPPPVPVKVLVNKYDDGDFYYI